MRGYNVMQKRNIEDDLLQVIKVLFKRHRAQYCCTTKWELNFFQETVDIHQGSPHHLFIFLENINREPLPLTFPAPTLTTKLSLPTELFADDISLKACNDKTLRHYQ